MRTLFPPKKCLQRLDALGQGVTLGRSVRQLGRPEGCLPRLKLCLQGNASLPSRLV